MPRLEDGTPVDIMLNSSGAIRRLNSDQLIEVELNMQAERIRQRLVTLPTMEEKEKLIFDFLELLQNDQYDYFYEMYQSFDKVIKKGKYSLKLIDTEAKRNFIKDIEEHGFYIKKPPFSTMRYDMIKRIYKAFPWIELYDVYVDMFGMRKKMMNKMVVGEMYMYLLKQTSNKNFSARSTGRLNKKNLPEKSSDKRDNRETFSTTPIKIGEVHNLMSAISGQTLAEHNIFLRSSPLGAKALGKLILGNPNEPIKISKLKIKPEYLNTNAVMLNSCFLGIGIGLEFGMKRPKHEILSSSYEPLFVEGVCFFDKPENKKYYKEMFDIKNKYLKNHLFIRPKDEKVAERMIWTHLFDHPEIFGDNPVQEAVRNIFYDPELSELNEDNKQKEEKKHA